MVAGWWRVLVGCGWCLSCAGSAKPTVSAATPLAAPVSAPPSPIEGTNSRVEAFIENDEIHVAGARVKEDDLGRALQQAHEKAPELVVKLRPPFDDAALVAVLHAAARAGFVEARLQQGEETLTATLGTGEKHARIITWLNGLNLSGYDLEAAADRSGVLGPFDLADPVAVERLRSELSAACGGQPCTAELDLVNNRGQRDAWQAVRAWNSAASNAGLSPQLVGVVLESPARPGEAPNVKRGATAVSGRLPPYVIQSIVRRSFGQFRKCYEAGLGRNDKLEGRVSARFVIGRDGKVSHVADGGSDLPDAEAVECTLKTFYQLQFPPPANGIVTVVYPIMFAPG